MTNTSRPCNTHPDLVAFKYRLPHTAEALTRQRKIKIVTIGSSSTAGTNGVLPFPPRLEFALRSDSCFYGRMIDVINRGVGGQEAPDEISRFECDVIAEALAVPARAVSIASGSRSRQKRVRVSGIDAAAAARLALRLADAPSA